MRPLRHSAPCRRRRGCDSAGKRGRSLVEVMVVIALLSALLTLAGQLMFRLLSVDGGVRRTMEQSQAAQRLVHDLRQDAHAASAAEPITDQAGQSTGLRLQTDSGPIEYRLQDRRIARLRPGNAGNAGNAGIAGNERGERYGLDAATATFTVENRLITLSLAAGPVSSSRRKPALLPLTIAAAFGADRSTDSDGAAGAARAAESANERAETRSEAPLVAPKPAGESPQSNLPRTPVEAPRAEVSS